uniref:Uncharacterized protein n=1 Tax=Chromera velia CCMP2878 TaxID=1169474 RepID=A0A0G4HL28_9ALVE|eukprot:Cvel_28652.t1-p1 / transcript=Cvel_28652.t1 / gene=Cvel_28652 / organism=Chromera_velia_CCMP2878 / gene_product=hypothetical protein / transcript_product=hypothetical protein / location=Cvel_scaffold3790:5123-8066(-) / protein_length=326 / sequence_SO=supercontig / SO=protein_coding / is_pseudo=false
MAWTLQRVCAARGALGRIRAEEVLWGMRRFSSSSSSMPPDLPGRFGPSPTVATGPAQAVASFFPKPEMPPQSEKKTGWGGRKFLIFVACNAVPVGVGIWMFKQASDERKAALEVSLPMDVEGALAQAEKVILANPTVTCLFNVEGFPSAVRVEPHAPEKSAMRLQEGQVVKGMANNILTDIFTAETSSFELPLNFVHFAASRNSSLGPFLEGDRRVSLEYRSAESDFFVTLQGVAVVVDSPEARRHYWRARWGASLPGPHSEEFLLLKLVPQRVRLQRSGGGREQWGETVLFRQVDEDANGGAGVIRWILESQSGAQRKENASATT